jgi:hypothetical protein
MKTIRINRAKWLRGKTSQKNYLWCSKRQAGCCLGHAIHQTTKCSWKDLDKIDNPRTYYSRESFLTEPTFHVNLTEPTFHVNGFKNNDFALAAMDINDDIRVDSTVREELLIKLFAESNIKLEFYN